MYLMFYLQITKHENSSCERHNCRSSHHYAIHLDLEAADSFGLHMELQEFATVYSDEQAGFGIDQPTLETC